jgi:glycosyltransferase involved in cell wall biosynthesis
VSDWPLISVITPTWQRHADLTGQCMPSVRAQTYPGEIEHVIVSDGPDPGLAAAMIGSERHGRRISLVLSELGSHDPAIRWGYRAKLRGIQLAHGELVAWLDDDNTFRPAHLHRLARLLRDRPDAGFAYSRIEMHHHHRSFIAGSDPPVYGGIDTSAILHRRRLLDIATWRTGVPADDWDLVERWMKTGVTWVLDPKITADYYYRDWKYPPALATREVSF